MRPLLFASLFALAACQPQSPDGAAAQPPADAPPAQSASARVSDFSQPMTARGNEPFWAVRIDGTRFTLLRPDAADRVFEAPGARIEPGKAVWQATAADGGTMKVTLYVSECSDEMSDMRYPMTAEVEVGGESLRGCAAKTADLKPEGS